jgi:hypothetical protein
MPPPAAPDTMFLVHGVMTPIAHIFEIIIKKKTIFCRVQIERTNDFHRFRSGIAFDRASQIRSNVSEKYFVQRNFLDMITNFHLTLMR